METDFSTDAPALPIARRIQQARRRVAEQMAIAASAYSIDGNTFTFEAPITEEITVGRYLRIETADDRSYLVQVHAKQIAERAGPEFSVQGDAGLSLDLAGIDITQTSVRAQLRYVTGTGVLLGRQDGDEFTITGPTDLFDHADIAPAPAETIARFIRSQFAGRKTLPIGSVQMPGDEVVPAAVLAAGFDRHTFLCGQSGSGKTYALGVILERLIVETDLRMIILDPNSDYVRIGELQRPIGSDEPDNHQRRFAQATEGLRVIRPAGRGSTADTELKICLSDLAPDVQSAVLQLDPIRDREEYNLYWSITERFGGRGYSPRTIQQAAANDLSTGARDIALRIANLGIANWGIWAEPDEPSLADLISEPWRVLVIDIGGLASEVEQSLVASAVLGMLWNARDQRQPTLIVIDEAHNVCPQEPSNPFQQTAMERAIRIAGEGRKFGLYLLVATQRPQKLHVNVLSQCDNLMLMRMNSLADIDYLSAVFSFVPASLLRLSSSFRQGGSLLAGKIVPTPTVVQFGGRYTQEGGGDIPTTWTATNRDGLDS